MPVLVTEGAATTEGELTLLGLNDVNGSLISPVGEAIGVGRMVVLVPLRFVLLEAGDARRERVLRKLDLRFGGGRMESALMGRGGILTLGFVSRSFWSSSRISMAVRVRVRLWFGARKRVSNV